MGRKRSSVSIPEPDIRAGPDHRAGKRTSPMSALGGDRTLTIPAHSLLANLRLRGGVLPEEGINAARAGYDVLPGRHGG
jgi:hypothetical protein